MLKKIAKRMSLVIMLAMLLIFIDEKNFLLAKSIGYQAVKAVVEYRADQMMPEFNVYETQHFKIKYKKEDEANIKSIARIFEESRSVIGQAYNANAERDPSKEKTIVMLYPNQQTLWGYQKSVMGQAVMGVYQLGIIHILSPNAYDMVSEDKMAFFEKEGPILHEYTHKVIDDLTGGNVELWFTEGLALYEEYDKNGTEWAPDFVYDRYYTAEELRHDFIDLDAVQAYRQSFDIINRLIAEYGKENLTALMAELKNGHNLDEAFDIVYHKDVNVFMAEAAQQAE